MRYAPITPNMGTCDVRHIITRAIPTEKWLFSQVEFERMFRALIWRPEKAGDFERRIIQEMMGAGSL